MNRILVNLATGRVVARRLDRGSSLRERALGLLARPALEPDEALWLSPCGGIHTCGMGYAIDVLFLDGSLRVLGVRRCVRPWRVVFAPRGTRSTVELRSGAAAAVSEGDTLAIEAEGLRRQAPR